MPSDPQSLDRIRSAVLNSQFRLTSHTNDELAADGLTVIDLESAVLTGEISRIQEDDPRGTRYTVTGLAADLTTPVSVVGRFLPDGRWLVITVYVLGETGESANERT